MYYTSRILTFFIAFSLPLFFMSCDDTTSADDELTDVPELPPFEEMALATGIFNQAGFGGQTEWSQKQQTEWKYRPEMQFFGSQQIRDQINADIRLADTPETPAFFLASTLVNNYQSAFFTNLTYSNVFTARVTAENAEMSNDEYLWDMEIEDEDTDETVKITVTATVSNDVVEWAGVATSDADEGGFPEQQVIEATTSADGLSGEWTVSLFQEEFEFNFESTITWEFGDEALEMLDLSFDMSEGRDDFYFQVDGFYNLEDPLVSITDGQVQSSDLNTSGIETDVDLAEIFDLTWNIDDGSGSLEIDGQNLCWDQAQADTDC